MSILRNTFLLGPMSVLLLLVAGALLSPLWDHGSCVPVDYPVSLSGGYALEIEDTGIYVDNLQPLSNENYLIRFENRNNYQVRYRLDISGVPSGWTVFLESGGRSAVVDLDPLATRSLYIYIKNPTAGTHEILMNTTLEGSTEHWLLVLRLIVQKGPVLVEPAGSTFTVGRDTPVEFDVKVSNIGSAPLNISLSMDRMVLSDTADEGTWTYGFSPREIVIPGGQNRTVRAVVRASETEKLGAQYISSVIATIDGINRPFISKELNFRVSTIFDLRATVSPPGYQRIAPGSSFQFTLTLMNLADDTDYVIVSEYEKPSEWSIGWNDTIDPTSLAVSVSPDSTREFHPVVFTSPTSMAGRHIVILKAKGTGNTTEIMLLIEIARKDQFEMRSSLPPDSPNTYKLFTGPNTFEVSLRNLGNFYDTATIEILSAPSFTAVRFVHVLVGAGSQRTVPAQSGTLNLSGSNDDEFDIGNWTGPLKLAFSPGQTAYLGVLATDIDPSTEAVSGKLVIKYTFGVFSSSKVLELELKVVLSDVEILSMDADSVPDLEIYPGPDYTVGDKVSFAFSVRNNYPLATSGLVWSIELSGTTLITGDLGAIPPGETKDFNVTWKASKATRIRNPAIVRITGRGYPDRNTAPSAKTDEPLYISAGPSGPSWGLIILFAGFMTMIISILLIAWLSVQSRLREREEEERLKYESLYGPRGRQAIGGRPAARTRSLEGRGDRALPSARARTSRPGYGPKKKGKLPRGRKEEGPAPSDLGADERTVEDVVEAAPGSEIEDISELYEVDEFEE